VLRRRRFFSGGYVRDSELKDIAWFKSDGREMTAEDWTHPRARAIGMLLGGDAIPYLNRFGEPIVGDTLLVITNGLPEPIRFVLPSIEWGERWEVLIDTRTPDVPDSHVPARAGEDYPMEGRSMVVMRLVGGKESGE
jgi:glycogen operon protein